MATFRASARLLAKKSPAGKRAPWKTDADRLQQATGISQQLHAADRAFRALFPQVHGAPSEGAGRLEEILYERKFEEGDQGLDLIDIIRPRMLRGAAIHGHY